MFISDDVYLSLVYIYILYIYICVCVGVCVCLCICMYVVKKLYFMATSIYRDKLSFEYVYIFWEWLWGLNVTPFTCKRLYSPTDKIKKSSIWTESVYCLTEVYSFHKKTYFQSLKRCRFRRKLSIWTGSVYFWLNYQRTQ